MKQTRDQKIQQLQKKKKNLNYLQIIRGHTHAHHWMKTKFLANPRAIMQPQT